jgi:hypothetical protein
VRPLGVEILVIPAIQLVDTDRGFLPIIAPHRFFSSLMGAQSFLTEQRQEIMGYFARTQPGHIYNMYHTTLARFFQLNPLNTTVRITHMAAQFGLCQLDFADMGSLMEVATKGVMDVMLGIYTASGQTVPIGPSAAAGSLPPIIHLPAPLAPWSKPLILCYFLVRTNATALDDLLLAEPMRGIDVHCFTSTPIEPRSQLHSHQKQRKLFQELFAQCTGIIVSAGNETVWEAVCRGVPVLTIPTEGHGEQLLNAATHQRNFPNLVRARPRLHPNDLSWLVNFNVQANPGARAESDGLRAKVTELQTKGSPLLGGTPDAW